jgi:hypothetical protein
MLSNAVRSAMTKLLVAVFGVLLCGVGHANAAEDRLDLIVAIDLTQSVAVAGPDRKTEFQKNVEGVSRVLAEVPAGTQVTIIGITDHSFAQPYILMSARTSADPGYFGERLNAARSQLVRGWKLRSAHLEAHFKRTDILGALELASQILSPQKVGDRRALVIFSDMRQNTAELNLESPSVVPSYAALARRCGALPSLQNVHVYVLGADGSGRSDEYWRSLRAFWTDCFCYSGGVLQSYLILREFPKAPNYLTKQQN